MCVNGQVRTRTHVHAHGGPLQGVEQLWALGEALSGTLSVTPGHFSLGLDFQR